MEQFPFPSFENTRNIISSGPFHPTSDRACEACNKKKTKCDKELPICGLCSRTNHECIYPTSRKRPSRHDHDSKTKIQKINGNIDRLLEILETNPRNGLDNVENDNQKGLNRKSARLDGIPIGSNGSTSLATPSHTPPSTGSGQKATEEMADTFEPSNSNPVPYELALHLLEVYFDKIQPWLGIFHQPTFMQWAEAALSQESNTLRGLGTVETMIFYGIFAMAARFSDHKAFAATIPRDRGEIFAKEAVRRLKVVEDIEEPSIQILQALLLSAHYHYGAGRSQKARTIALLCIRACYDLRLHEIDDCGEDDEDLSDAEWIDLELQRRVFWSTWECDLFGSILKRRPFGMDWRHIRVKLPVGDEAWFTAQRIKSAKFVPGPECWKSLSGVPNQDGRAWILLSKSMVGWFSDMALLKNGVTKEQKTSLENNISCFRLAMPDSYSLSSADLRSPDVSFIRKNYIIASNIYMCASAFTASQLPLSDDTTVRTEEEIESEETARYRNRSMELCQIIKKWPPECLLYAPPSLACALLTFNESLIKLLPMNELDTSYRDLSRLILSKFAERWTLGAILARIRDLAHHPEWLSNEDPANTTLMKEYPAYFNRLFITKDRRKKLRGSPEVHRSNSLESKSLSPSDAKPQTRSNRTSMVPSEYNATISQAPDASMNSSLVDSFSGTTSPGSMNDMLDPASIPGFGSVETLTGSPHDFDSIFSGFLQEPLWQDFDSINFLV